MVFFSIHTTNLLWPSVLSQGGWLLASFFFWVFFTWNSVLVHKRAKKRTRPMSSHLGVGQWHISIHWPQFLNILSTCEDHLSPSGTIERARQAVESASRCILANRAAAQNREDDSVFVESGRSLATNKQGICTTWANLSGLSLPGHMLLCLRNIIWRIWSETFTNSLLVANWRVTWKKTLSDIWEKTEILLAKWFLLPFTKTGEFDVRFRVT